MVDRKARLDPVGIRLVIAMFTFSKPNRLGAIFYARLGCFRYLPPFLPSLPSINKHLLLISDHQIHSLLPWIDRLRIIETNRDWVSDSALILLRYEYSRQIYQSTSDRELVASQHQCKSGLIL